jgi:hypothetical protein
MVWVRGRVRRRGPGQFDRRSEASGEIDAVLTLRANEGAQEYLDRPSHPESAQQYLESIVSAHVHKDRLAISHGRN